MSAAKLLLTSSIIILFFGCKVKHQTAPVTLTKQDTSSNSLIWISMIDSPGVNYCDAVASFDKYWEHREKPTEEDGEGKDIHETESKESKDKKAGKNIQYVYEYKRFLNWKQRNKNMVKPDCTIMTPEEILEQWNKTKNDTLSR